MLVLLISFKIHLNQFNYEKEITFFDVINL
jgi:hypothetical protein